MLLTWPGCHKVLNEVMTDGIVSLGYRSQSFTIERQKKSFKENKNLFRNLPDSLVLQGVIPTQYKGQRNLDDVSGSHTSI